MRKLLILSALMIPTLSGCGPNYSSCYKKCYAAMNVMPGPVDGPVALHEFHEIQDDLERVRKADFADCVMVGKLHFSGPPVRVDLLKRFAAKKGANVILFRGVPQRAGLDFECRCNPIGSHEKPVDDARNENETLVVSKSVSVGGSAAAGPGATMIFAHQVWFLYRDEPKQ